MSSLDGGSAAPPTADVPTEDRATDLRTPARWLNDPEFAGIEILDYDGWRGADWRTPVTVQEFRRRLWLCTITGPVRRSPDHSGVAGEPEATTKEAPEIAVAVSPTPTHAPTPETPGAVNVAGAPRLPAELRGDGPCHDCGTEDNIVWFAENVLWNHVMGGPGTMDDPGGIVCIPCFVIRVDKAGLAPTGWRLLPEWRWMEASRG